VTKNEDPLYDEVDLFHADKVLKGDKSKQDKRPRPRSRSRTRTRTRTRTKTETRTMERIEEWGPGHWLRVVTS
jgi:hypothetical protein